MILTHESGSQEDQFDGKKRRSKISWYYPIKVRFEMFAFCRNDTAPQRQLSYIVYSCSKKLYSVHDSNIFRRVTN